jgi:hypothetical protein
MLWIQVRKDQEHEVMVSAPKLDLNLNKNLLKIINLIIMTLKIHYLNNLFEKCALKAKSSRPRTQNWEENRIQY